MQNSGCTVGYRINQPYLEVKLFSADPEALEKLRLQFEALIGQRSVSTQKQTASAQLKQWLIETGCRISIDDQITGGLLSTALLSPESYPYVTFTDQQQTPHSIHITLSGLTGYWNNLKEDSVLQIEIHSPHQNHQVTLPAPFRKERTPLFAMEIACWKILNFLSQK